jgi:hypothetical protein
MSSPSGHLSNNHRDTLMKVFQHPTSRNIEWPATVSLLNAVGSVEERREGKYRVKVGEATEFLAPPKHKNLDVDEVLKLRRMLTAAGYDALVREWEAGGKQV